jgi:hypothetical protein
MPVRQDVDLDAKYAPVNIPRSGKAASETVLASGSAPKQITKDKSRENPMAAKRAYRKPSRV